MAEYLRTEHWRPDGDAFVVAFDVLRGEGLPGSEEAEVVHLSTKLFKHLLDIAGFTPEVDGPTHDASCHTRQGGVCRG